MQNKAFEEIDFSSINFNFTSNNYTYTKIDIKGVTKVNNFSDDISKMITKDPSLSNIEAQNKVVCEIIRDALSHGKIDLDFKVDENNNLKEYIVFNDTYHSKTRKLEMTLDVFEDFLMSEAFTIKYPKNKVLTKSIK